MSINELVSYRISRALETFDEAILLAKENHWNATANRLYYSCFYLVNALLIQKQINCSTHNGIKTEFHKTFVKPKLVSNDSGKLYSRLFNLRQEGDYLDFKRLEKDDVFPFIEDVKLFLSEIQALLT
jgi:uncharacterized protein (UPF0332 family)